MTQIIKGNTGDWEIVIGLEVHAQIKTNSKLFSGSPTSFGAEPNTQVSFIDAAMPGMLPVLNEQCVYQAVRTGLGIRAKINLKSIFDRKNYFYADLPQGYQISQFSDPIVGEGTITLDMKDGSSVDVGVERIHIEQDAGKSMHDQSPVSSFIDLNRSGIALMEIVSKPDMRSGEQAAEYMKKLRSIVRYLDTCDGDMEKGSMRCDANISVRPVGSDELRTRCEIKNLNSLKFLQQAIAYEANRHVEIYETGGVIDQETRLFDSVKCETRTMRSKEDAHDYRYFPDPDLLPIELTEDYVQKIKEELPELPDNKKQRYIDKLGLTAYDASVIVSDKETASYFEAVASKHNPKLSANWITSNLFEILKKSGDSIENSKVKADDLIGLLDLIENETISGKIAKDVFAIMYETCKPAKDIVEEKGLKQVTDTKEIEAIIDSILEQNSDKVEQYKSGKDKLFGFFVGQAMKATSGKASPKTVNEILKDKLNK
jgi:aspartyl-tRNA(Asn)/glutamyl-tRNA(Gln) amidotransferase subunit B